jgi:hypothetical protein
MIFWGCLVFALFGLAVGGYWSWRDAVDTLTEAMQEDDG